MSSTRRDLANVKRRLARSEHVSDADLLNLFLGVHSVPLGRERSIDLVDPSFNKGSMWDGVPYQPLRLDIDSRFLPNLDHVCDWRDSPNVLGDGRVKTVVADPLFMPHLGKKSVMQGYASDKNPFADDDILPQVSTLLEAVKKLLHPTEGTFILKIGDIVHSGLRQWQPDKVLDLAEQAPDPSAEVQTRLYKCDRWVNPSASMPDTKQYQVLHLPSQVHWLVFHTVPPDQCPGPGFVLPGRIRCAWCNRVVAVKRERQPGYCRLDKDGRSCRQLAYLERLRKAA